MTTTIDETLEEMHADGLQRLKDMVLASAQGEPSPPAPTIREILDASQKSTASLRDAVSRGRERKRAATDLENIGKSRARLSDLESEKQGLVSKVQSLHEEYRAAREPIDTRVREIIAEIRQLRLESDSTEIRAKRTLYESADPALHHEIRERKADSGQISSRIDSLRRQKSDISAGADLPAELSAIEQRLEFVKAEARQNLEDEAERIRRRIAQAQHLQDQIDELIEERAGVSARIAQLDRALYDWTSFEI